MAKYLGTVISNWGMLGAGLGVFAHSLGNLALEVTNSGNPLDSISTQL